MAVALEYLGTLVDNPTRAAYRTQWNFNTKLKGFPIIILLAGFSVGGG